LVWVLKYAQPEHLDQLIDADIVGFLVHAIGDVNVLVGEISVASLAELAARGVHYRNFVIFNHAMDIVEQRVSDGLSVDAQCVLFEQLMRYPFEIDMRN
jgi:hypothetical protein